MNEGNNACKTRGRPFAKGNSGRPKGARHKSTILAEQLLASDVDGVVRSVVKAAKRGNMVAAKIVLDRLAPPRRSRAIHFDLPPIADTAGLIAAFAALTSGVADGTLTPDEAASVATLLEAQRKAIETHELSMRIAALENRDETA
jgi:hypothetical protein